MIITSERGEKWLVKRGDPAWDKVRALVKVGYGVIVLPEGVIRGKMGVEDVPLPTLEPIANAYEQLEGEQKASLKEYLLRHFILYDCLRYLRENVV